MLCYDSLHLRATSFLLFWAFRAPLQTQKRDAITLSGRVGRAEGDVARREMRDRTHPWPYSSPLKILFAIYHANRISGPSSNA